MKDYDELLRVDNVALKIYVDGNVVITGYVSKNNLNLQKRDIVAVNCKYVCLCKYCSSTVSAFPLFPQRLLGSTKRISFKEVLKVSLSS